MTVFCCSDFLESAYYDYVGVCGHERVLKGSPSARRINMICYAAFMDDQESFKHMLRNHIYSSEEKIQLLSLNKNHTEIINLLMTHMTPLEIQEGLK